MMFSLCAGGLAGSSDARCCAFGLTVFHVEAGIDRFHHEIADETDYE
jgi:hypothetical protein